MNERPGSVAPFLLLFGTLYFVQGVVEPTACLPYQPVQSQLQAGSFSAEEIGRFFGVIGIAWSIKPLFGLLTDFWPIAGQRRKPYLVLAAAATAAAFFGLAVVSTSPREGTLGWLGWLLVVVGFGVAMSDVTIDALAVETGQPRGITGQIQSVQWCALSIAGVLAGVAGGSIAQHQLQRPMFAGCGILAVVSLVVVLLVVKEPAQNAGPRRNLRAAFAELWSGQPDHGMVGGAEAAWSGRRMTMLAAAAAFLLLWNFNPFSSNVLQDYSTKELRFSEQAFGNLLAVQSAGMIVGCLSYGWYCRRVPFGLLVHGSIVAGIASTLGYWMMVDWTTAVIANFVFGLAWQTGFLVQLDLAARICPVRAAGTMFALLMAITNSGQSVGIYVGGGWYDALALQFEGNRHAAFHVLVGIGASFTAACWLIVPVMRWAGVAWK